MFNSIDGSSGFSRREFISAMFVAAAASAMHASCVRGYPLTSPSDVVPPGTQFGQVLEKIDWPTFMARHDLIWNQIPARWENAPFVGNGMYGATIYTDAPDGLLAWHMGRRDVVYREGRIAIGDLVLKTMGKPQSVNMRMDLWNAQITGTLKTSAGQIEFRSFTPSTNKVQLIEILPDQGEAGCQWQWRPGVAADSRLLNRGEQIPGNGQNPKPELTEVDAIHLCVQKFNTGGGDTVAWTEIPGESGSRVAILSIGFSPQGDAGEAEAVAAVKAALAAGPDDLTAAHRDWWHNFYPQSFVSFPNTRLESFYWIQMYKLGSGTRADVPVLDTMGPWYRVTNFPRIWWNLNVQLTYWPVLGSNHLDLGESMTNTLDKNLDHLSANAGEYRSDSYALGRSGSYDLIRPVGQELCDLPWACHNYWLQYRYSMDEPMLRDRLFPLLKGSINYYLHMLQTGPDGKLHTIKGFSPEYPDQPVPDPDCNIDLGLIRWGCQTLLDICAQFNIDDPLIPKWQETLAQLRDYPVDENGLRISASVAYAMSHRHYSHMLMMYPLYLMNWENPKDRALMQTSFNHWTSMRTAWAGFSYTGAAAISASMRNGDAAEKFLDGLMSFKGIHPNTMYTEGSPVIETPLSAAQSVHDMLVQSWGDKIRIFPAVPADWTDVSIHRMRTQGAFLVSAVRRGGVTQFVEIISVAGEPCRIWTDIPNPVSDNQVAIKPVGDGVYEVGLSRGRSVVIYPAGTSPTLVIEPVAAQPDQTNFWGLHA
jgi:alpha-L-fucosidase 2